MKRIAMIGFFGLAALLLAGSSARADDGLSVGFGQAAIGSEVCFDSLVIAQELADRKWLATLGTHGSGHCRDRDVRANFGVGIARCTHLGKHGVCFGADAWEHGDRAVGPKEGGDRPQLGAHIHLRRYALRDRLVVDLWHFSTGGSTEWNSGLNLIAVGVRIPE